MGSQVLTEKMAKKRILTGDRPTGKLHLGHYFGSLKNRADLQDEFETFIIVADWQAFYDRIEEEKGQKIKENVREVVLGNIAAGVDPRKVTFFVQSEIPELAELTMIFQFLVSVARAKRNPTVKGEMEQCGFEIESDKKGIEKEKKLAMETLEELKNSKLTGEKSEKLKKDVSKLIKEFEYFQEARENEHFDRISVGFLAFPISQAADILLPKADLVPVGEDQLPHIEQTREVARKFNRLFGETFPEPEGKVSEVPRLRGLDGKDKMSKSLKNTINLDDSKKEVEEKVKKAFSGEGHALFEWSELVGLDWKKFEKDGEVRMGDFKPALAEALNEFLEPMRKRRADWDDDAKIDKILKEGREKMRKIGQETMKEVRKKMGIDFEW